MKSFIQQIIPEVISSFVTIIITVMIVLFILKSTSNTHCKNILIPVDSKEEFSCKHPGKISIQVIDDIKYNACLCKESK